MTQLIRDTGDYYIKQTDQGNPVATRYWLVASETGGKKALPVNETVADWLVRIWESKSYDRDERRSLGNPPLPNQYPMFAYELVARRATERAAQERQEQYQAAQREAQQAAADRAKAARKEARKQNRAEARAEVAADFRAWRERRSFYRSVQRYPCPTCSVGPWQPCVTPRGQHHRLPEPHKSRVAQYRRMGGK